MDEVILNWEFGSLHYKYFTLQDLGELRFLLYDVTLHYGVQ